MIIDSVWIRYDNRHHVTHSLCMDNGAMIIDIRYIMLHTHSVWIMEL